MPTWTPTPATYNKRPLNASNVGELVERLTIELGNVERAIRDTNLTPTRTVTASTTLTTADALALVDATAGAVTVTLPNVVTFIGRTFTVKKVDASANVVTVGSVANIDGAATYPLAAQYDTVTVCSDGATWWVISTA